MHRVCAYLETGALWAFLCIWTFPQTCMRSTCCVERAVLTLRVLYVFKMTTKKQTKKPCNKVSQ